MKTYVLLIDCNNFFVSCERLFRPDLEKRPVLVLSSNDGCAVARSQEVKDSGIAMGSPFFQIKDIIKDKGITVFSGNHTLYRNLSRRVMRVIEAEGRPCEQYSIDEAFLLFEALDAQSALAYARTLRQKIQQWVGIPVSVGIGFSKTQAKLANRYAKQTDDGVFYCDQEWCLAQVDTLPVGVIWGIGARLAERYRRFGIVTVTDVIRAPEPALRKIGGVVAVRQQAELSDRYIFKVGELAGPQKSLMSSQTFGKATANIAIILDAIAHHVRSVTTDMQQKKLVTDTFQVYLRPKDRSFTKSLWLPIYLPEATNGNATVLAAVTKVMAEAIDRRCLYNKVGLLALRTHSVARALQGQLFAEKTVSNKGNIDELLTALSSRYGSNMVQIGNFTTTPTWRAQRQLRSPQYLTDWRDVPVIQTNVTHS